ncbi:GNAT family N-acetyltransferase [Arthrobacter sp. GMC3]|uniref:GNAT family N-acetyltransferase n=1 Tax=Arthrobacter sp. GMC3 TaxID=2058894 RepID=UPI000CE40A62|nr:hypothetical protein [Arthrobacter sp. GMC3]
MEPSSALTYTATSLSSAYALAADSPNAWARPTLAFSHNQQLSQFEVYRAGTLAGFTRYSMRGSEMWLLFTHLTREADSHTTEALIRDVLDDASRRRISVHPYCTVTREFMRENPSYIALVPAAVHQRFRLGAQSEAATHRIRVTRQSAPSQRKEIA